MAFKVQKINSTTNMTGSISRIKSTNIPKWTTIGKKCQDDPDMMFPNPNFLTYFSDAELPDDQGRDARSSCLRIGTWLVFEKLMMESMVDKIIISIYHD